MRIRSSVSTCSANGTTELCFVSPNDEGANHSFFLETSLVTSSIACVGGT
jgi:hypothetical protein